MSDQEQGKWWHVVRVIPKYPHLDPEYAYICCCGQVEPVIQQQGDPQHGYAMDETEHLDRIVADHNARLTERQQESALLEAVQEAVDFLSRNYHHDHKALVILRTALATARRELEAYKRAEAICDCGLPTTDGHSHCMCRIEGSGDEARLVESCVEHANLRRELEEALHHRRHAWAALGCRCIFNDDDTVRLEESHCPIHGWHKWTADNELPNVPELQAKLTAAEAENADLRARVKELEGKAALADEVFADGEAYLVFEGQKGPMRTCLFCTGFGSHGETCPKARYDALTATPASTGGE